MENSGLISIKTMIREGIPSEEILKAAEEENVELIITGCNGKKGLDRLITGCVSKEVERSSGVPVLVARDMAEEDIRGLKEANTENFKKILRNKGGKNEQGIVGS